MYKYEYSDLDLNQTNWVLLVLWHRLRVFRHIFTVAFDRLYKVTEMLMIAPTELGNRAYMIRAPTGAETRRKLL